MSKSHATIFTGKPTTGPSAEPGTEAAPSDGGKVTLKDKTVASKKAPKEVVPKKASKEATPDPTRYGDWEKKGRCIDF